MHAKTIQKNQVTSDMTIGEVVLKYPMAAQVMLSYGLHCIGCHVNIYETIEQGVLGHGMTKKDVDKMLRAINKNIEELKTDDRNPVILTSNAVNKVKELAQKQKKKDFGLKIGVGEGGCAGFSYSMSLVRSPKQDDITLEQKNIKIFISKKDLELLKGSSIDYLESFSKSGFVVNNPNAHSTCSCGQSFH